MSSNELVEQIMAQVIARVATPEHEVLPKTTHQIRETAMAEKSCTLTEFVGTAIGDTVGLVIANVDSALLDAMKLEKRYRSIGILGARIGAGPHIMAADEAVKATNTEVISIELPRDTKGGAGHGSLILLGGNDVSDVKRGIEVALKELDRTFGDVYANEAGHLELQYTARASYALEKAFGAQLGRACGVIVGAPAAVGVLMADTALKSANVDVVAYSSPAQGTSYSNEVILIISGDSGAVRQAVISAREIGKTVLSTLGDTPKNDRPSYI
ncbi:propanediol utilization microcompartment protein PduB [Escherichia coli]|uniref:propanediol utilization microcompartment protein PduB n=1 Tax=Escherichia coli TaxID=562 RepID=UPI000BDFA80C|nr:propanediol utilization microcompartment protein PduB [Escherichia coli]EEZ5267623.1 propanediol utilization microcompartment protein PduB [Escherichia coli]EFC6421447.1 propanediol utilization microcompartment protein PduB [Escherichia coli]EIT2619689.1 propanediol utilization microcompartment protein PduB [Escherichia coli]MBB8436463.1 propanediol utilization microcompartment protein PduB [Escherichia coli]HBM8013821.1 propanediol utilization microcompartment protein PduB [Escherichia col